MIKLQVEPVIDTSVGSVPIGVAAIPSASLVANAIILAAHACRAQAWADSGA